MKPNERQRGSVEPLVCEAPASISPASARRLRRRADAGDGFLGASSRGCVLLADARGTYPWLLLCRRYAAILCRRLRVCSGADRRLLRTRTRKQVAGLKISRSALESVQLRNHVNAAFLVLKIFETNDSFRREEIAS